MEVEQASIKEQPIVQDQGTTPSLVPASSSDDDDDDDTPAINASDWDIEPLPVANIEGISEAVRELVNASGPVPASDSDIETDSTSGDSVENL